MMCINMIIYLPEELLIRWFWMLSHGTAMPLSPPFGQLQGGIQLSNNFMVIFSSGLSCGVPSLGRPSGSKLLLQGLMLTLSGLAVLCIISIPNRAKPDPLFSVMTWRPLLPHFSWCLSLSCWRSMIMIVAIATFCRRLFFSLRFCLINLPFLCFYLHKYNLFFCLSHIGIAAFIKIFLYMTSIYPEWKKKYFWRKIEGKREEFCVKV